MSAMSDYLEGEIIKHVFRTGSFTKPAELHIGLIPVSRGYWQASTAYGIGDYVLPTTPNGRLYKCTTAGTTGAAEPTWPTTDGGTVNDGTAVWEEQTVALDAASGSTIPEVSGGSYARVQRDPADANWSAPASGNGMTDNVGEIAFPAPSANWGLIYGLFVADAASAGNTLFKGALTTPKTVNNGDPAPKFAVGELDVTFA